jgi:hypothetical protein
MDLEPSVFKRDARAIAASLKRSAERSRRRKSPPYRSAMSMLTFYVNRGGRNISAPQRRSSEPGCASCATAYLWDKPFGGFSRGAQAPRWRNAPAR